MKKTPAFFILASVLLSASARAEEPVSAVVRTRNWQGYAFQTSIAEDGRFERRFRKDGGPDLSEAPLIEEGAVSPANREHLAKIVERSGIFALEEDAVKKDISVDSTKNRFEGQLSVKLGARSKTVRFGPNVESVPDAVFQILDEISRIAQVER